MRNVSQTVKRQLRTSAMTAMAALVFSIFGTARPSSG